jgi:hypothetical protein
MFQKNKDAHRGGSGVLFEKFGPTNAIKHKNRDSPLITPLKELAQNLKDPLWISSSKSVLCIYDCIQKNPHLMAKSGIFS